MRVKERDLKTVAENKLGLHGIGFCEAFYCEESLHLYL
jgi:hypothetical protein